MEQDTSKQLGQYSEDTLTYYPNGTVQVRMENILTTDKVLFPGMLMPKSKGIRWVVVRVLKIWDKNGFLYIKFEDNETSLVGTISKRIGIDFYLWTLISYEYIADKFIFKNLKWKKRTC